MELTSFLNGLMPFPLVAVISGGHEPQWVEGVIARVNELDHEMLTVLTGFMILVARDEMDVN